MIVISDCSKDIVIPAGLGNNPGVIYDVAGVKSLNGETGDLKIKTVNGNDMLGEGNIEIKGGVETVNGETGDVKIKTVNGQSLMGEGDVPVDVGVETLNGQKGNLKIKSVNGTEMLGEGNVAIDTGVETLNGQKGALTLKTVNGNELTGDGNIEIQAGVSSVNGKTGDVTVYDLGNYAICALQMSDITLSEQDTDVMLYNYGAGYDNGGWSRYMSGDRTVQILLIGTRDGRGYKVPVEIHLMHDNQENAEMHFTIGDYRYVYSQVSNMHWRFTSKTPVNSGATNALTYKQITNENRQEVYDDVKAHWSDASGYTGNYVYFYQKDKDQIIFDEVKFENNEAYFNSAAINYTSGQVHNPLIRLLCCIIRPEESMELAENKRVISDINGMRYICGGVINDGDSISFTTNNYGDGYDIYESTNTGGRDGMFDAQFENGIGGYKGNTPANIFTDGTDVFMAFDVVDNHYVYKKVDNSWAFVSKTKIGGVQSSEVSNIKVLTQAEYDALTAKDENVLYCIKG